ncbi:MAG: 50S ribosomal protein L15 [Myxococcales bacterium]|nr:50S ribosomal protein L15 [Myxococcales bacterium]TDJ02632.1 MAG: 50S ribosomal protein L15 [Deltaproteobacteria bacterium]TDJ07023.1 MAG: 50S ribosomal protein L15 [Deltaproteobacteria bacterium]
MMLDRLTPKPGSRERRQRKGRGMASGHGRTCGRGQKGAGARSGSRRRAWQEGGQMPLSRRLPKFGFTNIFRVPRQVVNLRDLARFEAGTVVDPTALAGAGLVARADRPVKVLAQGEISVALKLRVDAVSEGARKKVEAAGGGIELVPTARRKPKAELR